MPGEGLPQGLGQLFADGGADQVLDVDLPPGSLVVPAGSAAGTRPAYWLSDEPAGPDLWVRLHKAHPRSGLWPVIASPYWRSEERPWVAGEVDPHPRPAPGVDRLIPAEVLEGFWAAWVNGEHHLRPAVEDSREAAGAFRVVGSFRIDPGDDFPELEPFGRSWPGLAPATGTGREPEEFADQWVRGHDDGTSRIMLVAAGRGADVLAVVGWEGAVNYITDESPLSSVLRSWEDRFGARLVQVGFDTLTLSVAAPPVTTGHSERVAAEHFAFCPDNIIQSDDTTTIGAYAREWVQGKDGWGFWWD
jgi:hypothetical protein